MTSNWKTQVKAANYDRLQADNAKLRTALEKLLKDHEGFFGKESISEWKGVIAARKALAEQQKE
jgi:hypothetical protein